MAHFRPERTLTEAFASQTEQNIGPLSVYRIITDWVEVVAETTDFMLEAIHSAQEQHKNVSQSEQARFITLAKNVLFAFHSDLNTLYGKYKHSWKPLYTADSMELQSHIQHCIDALNLQIHLRVNIQLLINIVIRHVLAVVDERAPLVLKYTEHTSSDAAMKTFEYSRSIAREKEKELESQTLQLVDV